MSRVSYADLLVTRACFYLLIEINLKIQAQNAEILDQSEQLLKDNARLLDVVSKLEEQLDFVQWRDDQSWDEFPIQ